MKMTAMSSSCQICSCYCDGELSFIICCACLCQLLLTVCIDLREQRGAEVTLINTLQHMGIRPSWHSITWDKKKKKKEELKTQNMLRNAELQYGNMTIINREMDGICLNDRGCFQRLLCTGVKCTVPLVLYVWPFGSSTLLVALHFLGFFKSNIVLSGAVKSPGRPSRAVTGPTNKNTVFIYLCLTCCATHQMQTDSLNCEIIAHLKNIPHLHSSITSAIINRVTWFVGPSKD